MDRGEVGLPFPRHDHSSGVLGGVADQRDHDQADEHLGQTEACHHSLGRMHQDFTLYRDQDRRHTEHRDRAPWRRRRGLFRVTRRALEDAAVPAQRKNEARGVRRTKDQRDRLGEMVAG